MSATVRIRVFLCLVLRIAEAIVPGASVRNARSSAPSSRHLFGARRLAIDGFEALTLTHGERERTYHLYVPESVKSGSSSVNGLVMFFHGKGVTVDDTCHGEHGFGFSVKPQAEAKGFIAVCPEGLSGPKGGKPHRVEAGWNCDVCCGWPSDNKVDDVGFVNAMLGKLKSDLEGKNVKYPSKNVFAFGFSTGGLFAYRLACELKGQIHGVAPTGASFNHGFGQTGRIAWAEKCETSVPVWNSLGTEDTYTDEEEVVDGFVQYAEGQLKCERNRPGCRFRHPRDRVECLEYTKCEGKTVAGQPVTAKLCIYDGAYHAVKALRDNDTDGGYAYGHTEEAWDYLTGLTAAKVDDHKHEHQHHGSNDTEGPLCHWCKDKVKHPLARAIRKMLHKVQGVPRPLRGKGCKPAGAAPSKHHHEQKSDE